MKKEIVLVGGGGHCKVCIDVIRREGKFKVAGIVDVKEKQPAEILGCKIIGVDKDLPKLTKKYDYFLVTMGQIKNAAKRIKRFEWLKKLGAKFPVIISPLASISRHTIIKEGTIIMHGVVVNANTEIGTNCIVNTQAIIEHDVVIGDHCHISTGSIVNGACRIGNRAFIGSNGVIANNISVADDTVIGAGAVVVKSINKRGTYAGNPARKLS